MNELDIINQEIFEKFKKNNGRPGFFNDNHILFLGLAPSVNTNEKELLQKQQIFSSTKWSNVSDIDEELIMNSKMGCIMKMINKNTKMYSYTNLIKSELPNNNEPQQVLTNNEIEEHINYTLKQIKILKPNIVIVFGKITSNLLDLKIGELIKKNDTFFYSMYHPSFLCRQNNIDTQNYIKQVIKSLNTFAKTKMITRVTNIYVYYLSIQGFIEKYKHSIQNNYYFIETNENSKYKSIYGHNLKKIYKQRYLDTQTFEKHLLKKDMFYYNNLKNIRHSQYLPYAIFDIENNMSLDTIHTPEPIISISFYLNHTKKYYCCVLKKYKEHIINELLIKQKLNLKEDIKIFEYDTEFEMLNFFLNTVLNSKRLSLLSGWNINKFDLPYLINRAQKLNVNITDVILQNNYYNTIQKYRDIVIFDALSYYRQKGTFFNKPPGYSLEKVYNYLFEKKGKIQNSSVSEMWKTNINNLIIYNIQDVKITKDIILKLKFFTYGLLLQSIVPQDFENIFYNSRTIENLLHHKYWNKNIFLPTKQLHYKKHYEGAIVFKPQQGIYKNICVFDFAAMYTSIYITFNISPDTYLGSIEKVTEKLEELKQKYNFNNINELIQIQNDFEISVFLPHHIKFGILPSLELELLNKRNKMKKERDTFKPGTIDYNVYEQLQATFKEILNSIYGVSSYERFILFNQCVSASITSIARQLLNFVKTQAEKKDFKVLYGDTDSIFIQILNETPINTANEFAKELNMNWSNFIIKQTQSIPLHNLLKIDFEKMFDTMLITNVKKKYFGFLSYYKGKILNNHKFSITGFETRRDDTPIFFKKELEQSYKNLLKENRFELIKLQYTRMKKDIKQVPIDELCINIKMSKNANEYSNKPIHLTALQNAKVTKQAGDIVNMLYVKNEHNNVTHYIEQKTYDIDYEKYLYNFFVHKLSMIDKTILQVLNDQKLLTDY